MLCLTFDIGGGVGNCCSNVTIIPCKDGAGVRDTRHGTILSRPWRENNIIEYILDENSGPGPFPAVVERYSQKCLNYLFRVTQVTISVFPKCFRSRRHYC